MDRAQANSESIAETGQKVESPTLAAKRGPLTSGSRTGCAHEDRCRRLTRGHEPATGPFSGLAGGKRGSRSQSPVRGAAEGCSGPAQRFEATYRRASENFHWPLSTYTGPGNPRGEHNDGNNSAAQGSKPNRVLAPVTASGLLPREDDAVPPQCAKKRPLHGRVPNGSILP